jgi:hypothetical protein
LGAVCVEGGAEKVLAPLLPPEKPPPALAFASAATSTSAATIAAIAMTTRCPIIVALPAMAAGE